MSETYTPTENDLIRVEAELLSYEDFGGDDETLETLVQECTSTVERPGVLTRSKLWARWSILKARAHRLRFLRYGSSGDIEEARDILEVVLPNVKSDPETEIIALYNLAEVSETVFWNGEQGLDALEHYRSLYQEAQVLASCTPTIDIRRKTMIQIKISHATLAYMHYGARDSLTLSGVFETLQLLVESANVSDPVMSHALSALSEAHRNRFGFFGQADSDLLKSEEASRAALLLLPLTHMRRPQLLMRLCGSNIERFMRDGQAGHLIEAIGFADEALELVEKRNWLGNGDGHFYGKMGVLYRCLYDAKGRLEDLDKSIVYLQMNGADRTLPMKITLVDHLYTRFTVLGRTRDIDDAVTVGRKVLECLTPDNPYFGHSLVLLGAALTTRFALGGGDRDHQAARSFLEDAVQKVQTNAFGMKVFALCHGMSSRLYAARYEASPLSADLDLAVKHGQLAVDAAAYDSYVQRSVHLSLLGELLLLRYQVRRAEDDLTDSLGILRSSWEQSMPMQAHRHSILRSLSRALRIRYDDFLDNEAMVKSIAAATEALRSLGEYHAQRSLCLIELASAHASRFRLEAHVEDLNSALVYYQEAAKASDGYIRDRFRAAVEGARLAQTHDKLGVAIYAFQEAIRLLPRIAWLGLDAVARHAALARTAVQLGCDAAAASFSIGQPRQAVQMLEQGKSVFWRSVLQLRTDLHDLTEVAPTLGEELLATGRILEHDDTSQGDMGEARSSAFEEERAQRRRRLAERWDSLTERVRTLDGFHNFLKPLSFSELNRAADFGPVVILNVSEYRSDALILLKDGLHTVPLAGLAFPTVRRLSYIFLQALRMAKDKEGCRFLERVLLDVARHLWEGGLSEVAAVLLELHRSTAQSPFRVWWLPTGPMSLLPVHCAGPYQIGHKGIPDLFISSYTTTLSALIGARASQTVVTRDSLLPRRMLAVGQPHVPGLPYLPSTKREMETLSSSPFANNISILYGKNADVEGVAKAIAEHHWIHFCTHGNWHAQQPLDSALSLGDGPLTLSRIVQMRLKDADFAYLSACHTARHATDLPDESMHLAAGLQIAGFRGVLATSWAMADRDGPVLAQQFYRFLVEGGRAIDARNAAEALHRAIQELRGTGMPLYRWGAFVHIGI